MKHAQYQKAVTLRTPSASAIALYVLARQGLQVITPKRNAFQVSASKTKYHYIKLTNQNPYPTYLQVSF